MKNRISAIPLIIIAIMLFFIFAGCNDNEKSLPDCPSDEEIDALMQESFFFFAAYEYNNDMMVHGFDEEEKVFVNGYSYFMAIEKYRDYKAWEDRIKATFTDELADVYLNHVGIINIDGTTYAIGGGASGVHQFELYTYEIKSAENGKAVLEITIPYGRPWDDDYVPEYKKSAVEMSYIERDGKWKISYEEYSFLCKGFKTE